MRNNCYTVFVHYGFILHQCDAATLKNLDVCFTQSLKQRTWPSLQSDQDLVEGWIHEGRRGGGYDSYISEVSTAAHPGLLWFDGFLWLLADVLQLCLRSPRLWWYDVNSDITCCLWCWRAAGAVRGSEYLQVWSPGQQHVSGDLHLCSTTTEHFTD